MENFYIGIGIGIGIGFIYFLMGMLYYSGDLSQRITFWKFLKIVITFILWPLIAFLFWATNVSPQDFKK
jgi:predicted Na+-dependent transporter